MAAGQEKPREKRRGGQEQQPHPLSGARKNVPCTSATAKHQSSSEKGQPRVPAGKWYSNVCSVAFTEEREGAAVLARGIRVLQESLRAMSAEIKLIYVRPKCVLLSESPHSARSFLAARAATKGRLSVYAWQERSR